MTYAVIAYVLSGLLWLAYLAWLARRLRRAAEAGGRDRVDRPADRPRTRGKP